MIKSVISSYLVLVLYSSSWCGWCTKQESELESLHIPYIKKDQSEKPPGMSSVVPVMVNDKGQVQVGYIGGEQLKEFARGY